MQLWSGSTGILFNHLVSGPCPTAPINFIKIQRVSSSRIRIVIRNGLLDPDSDADRHQNTISWFIGHIPALHKISSKSVGNFFDNQVNPDFGLRTPGSGRWSGSSPKFIPLVPWPCPTSPRNFVKIHSQLFQLSQLSDRQTNRQTDRNENITSFFSVCNYIVSQMFRWLRPT